VSKCICEFSETGGGNGGGTFNDARNFFDLPDLCDLSVEKVKVKYDKRIDQLSLVLRGNGKDLGPHGDGTEHRYSEEFNVPRGENIVRVIMRSGERVDSLQFVTDGNTYSKVYGGKGGIQRTYDLPGKLVGFFGKKGQQIDRLGFITVRKISV